MASGTPRRSWFSRIGAAALPCLALTFVDCYPGDDGVAPPVDALYFPVGLQVSAGGNVLYVVNSNFDLQYNGGTLQSYDLRQIRRDVVKVIADPVAASQEGVPVLEVPPPGACPGVPDPSGQLGEICAPPVDSTFYFRDAGVIGAFATDLLLSKPPAALEPSGPQVDGGDPPAGARPTDRLFLPVRGNASLTWADVARDRADEPPPIGREAGAGYAPFVIDCGKDAVGRCDAVHTAGTNVNERGNTRRVRMPGEPFGVAISEDGESLLVTHQNERRTSLFSTGLTRGDAAAAPAPHLDFILEGVPLGGVGLAAIPHDRQAFGADPASFPRPAFLQTSRFLAEIALLRRYPDEFGGTTSAPRRPFLDQEAVVPITTGAGSDSRGIVVDPTPRLACKAAVAPEDAATGRDAAAVARDLAACARRPARVFIANRTPASVLVGEIGGLGEGGVYDPDRLTLHSTIPLSTGPSKLYLAPVVESDGRLALRLFVVCFDSATLFIIEPDRGELEGVIRTATGPFAMAFDPFDMAAVARHDLAAPDLDASVGHAYRFGYLASFTNSFVQIVDLDNARADKSTFERVVFTLGRPTAPKGS